MPRNEQSPRFREGPEKVPPSSLSPNSNAASEVRRNREWSSWWRRELGEGDIYGVALATGQVDRLDSSVPSPFDITFAQARARAATHGCACACHPVPEPAPPEQRRSRGAA